MPSSHCHLFGMDTLRGGGGFKIVDGCVYVWGGGLCQDYEYNINNDFISENN